MGVRWRWSSRWFPKKGLVVGVARLVVWMLVGKAKLGDESVLVDCGGDCSAMLALLRMGRGSCDDGKEGGRGLLVLTGLAVLESSSSVSGLFGSGRGMRGQWALHGFLGQKGEC